jgi:hypothetical protein
LATCTSLIAPILGLFAPTETPKISKGRYCCVSKVIGKLIGFAITTVCVVVVLLLHHSGYFTS